MQGKCFECEIESDIHLHHVVPKSLGGKKTVPLCEACHYKIHDMSMSSSVLARAAIKKRKAENKNLGGPPYGYKVGKDGILEEDEKEQLLVKFVLSVSDNNYSYSQIAALATKEGFTNRIGNTISHDLVKRVLKRFKEEIGILITRNNTKLVIPFGFYLDADGKLQQHYYELNTLYTIKFLVESGVSDNDIANLVNNKCFRDRLGNSFTEKSIPAYYQLACFLGSLVKSYM